MLAGIFELFNFAVLDNSKTTYATLSKIPLELLMYSVSLLLISKATPLWILFALSFIGYSLFSVSTSFHQVFLFRRGPLSSILFLIHFRTRVTLNNDLQLDVATKMTCVVFRTDSHLGYNSDIFQIHHVVKGIRLNLLATLFNCGLASICYSRS